MPLRHKDDADTVQRVRAGDGQAALLLAEGKELTDDYMGKDSETMLLIEKAVNEPGFFLDLEDDALIRYSDVCIKLNRLLRLKVSGVEKI